MSNPDIDQVLAGHCAHKVRQITPEKLADLYGYIFKQLYDAMREQRDLNDLPFLANYVDIQRRQLAVDVKKLLVADLLRLLG